MNIITTRAAQDADSNVILFSKLTVVKFVKIQHSHKSIRTVVPFIHNLFLAVATALIAIDGTCMFD